MKRLKVWPSGSIRESLVYFDVSRNPQISVIVRLAIVALAMNGWREPFLLNAQFSVGV
jgi:hypothetical protein